MYIVHGGIYDFVWHSGLIYGTSIVPSVHPLYLQRCQLIRPHMSVQTWWPMTVLSLWTITSLLQIREDDHAGWMAYSPLWTYRARAEASKFQGV